MLCSCQRGTNSWVGWLGSSRGLLRHQGRQHLDGAGLLKGMREFCFLLSSRCGAVLVAHWWLIRTSIRFEPASYCATGLAPTIFFSRWREERDSIRFFLLCPKRKQLSDLFDVSRPIFLTYYKLIRSSKDLCTDTADRICLFGGYIDRGPAYPGRFKWRLYWA